MAIIFFDDSFDVDSSADWTFTNAHIGHIDIGGGVMALDSANSRPTPSQYVTLNARRPGGQIADGLESWADAPYGGQADFQIGSIGLADPLYPNGTTFWVYHGDGTAAFFHISDDQQLETGWFDSGAHRHFVSLGTWDHLQQGWLRVRTGYAWWSFFTSPDGVIWTQWGGVVTAQQRDDIVPHPKVQAGVSHFSHNPSTIARVRFATSPVYVVEFDGSVSTGSPISRYRWSFGDGTESNEMSPTKIYPHDGPWNVNLTVTDIYERNSQVRATLRLEQADHGASVPL